MDKAAQNISPAHKVSSTVTRKVSSREKPSRAVGNHAMLRASQLHPTLGNQGTIRRLQAKLTINTPGDQFEQEADRTADAVMRTPDPTAAYAPAASIATPGTQLQRAPATFKPPSRPVMKVTLDTPIPAIPAVDYSLDDQQLGAWENANFKTQVSRFAVCDDIVNARGDTVSFVTDITFRFDKPQFEFFIAGNIRDAMNDRSRDAGDRVVWHQIHNRILVHAQEHFHIDRTVVDSARADIQKRFAALPDAAHPSKVPKEDLQEYADELLTYLEARLKHDLWKANCDWERKDYPRLLKGLSGVWGELKVSKDCENPRAVPPQPLLPIVVTPAASSSPGVQRKSAAAAEQAGMPALPFVHHVLQSPGRPLDAATRAFMEPRFGQDFRLVRVHDGTQAAESAKSVNALAYTVGQDIVFGSGALQPETSEGRRLIAHELTHVTQQRNSPMPLRAGISAPGDFHERQAGAAADSLMRGAAVTSLLDYNKGPPVLGSKGTHQRPRPHPSRVLSLIRRVLRYGS